MDLIFIAFYDDNDLHYYYYYFSSFFFLVRGIYISAIIKIKNKMNKVMIYYCS